MRYFEKESAEEISWFKQNISPRRGRIAAGGLGAIVGAGIGDMTTEGVGGPLAGAAIGALGSEALLRNRKLELGADRAVDTAWGWISKGLKKFKK